MPVILFWILYKKGKLVNMDATIKEERNLPFFIVTLFYIGGLLILNYYKVNIILIAFWFCYISNTIFILIINRFWKISAHAMGAAGPAAFLIYVYGYTAAPIFLLLFVIGWSRIKLKCHNLAQVSAGALTGFISTILQLYIITGMFK